MRTGRALRRLVQDRILAEVPAFDGRVYDKAAEDTDYPYVTLGPSYWLDASVECILGRRWTVQVDIWASGTEGSGKGSAEDLVDDVAAALAGWSDTVALTMHPMQVGLVRVMDDPSGCVHGVVQVEARTEG